MQVDIRKWFFDKPQRYLTIKVITDTGATTRNLVLSRRAVRLVKIGAVVALALTVAGQIAIVDAIMARGRVSVLRDEVSRLKKENQSIARLREQLAEIWIIHRRLQAMLGSDTPTQDLRLAERVLPWGMPLVRWTGTGLNMRPTNRPERGINFRASAGDLVLATAAGQVADIRWEPGYGNTLVIDHGDGVETWYAQDVTTIVRPRENVAQGQVIGVIAQAESGEFPALLYRMLVDGRPVNPLASMMASVTSPREAPMASAAPTRR